MGSPALTWTLAAVSVLVTVVSAARLAAADSGEARFAAGGDVVMAGGMAAMFLPATAASFGDHSLWWVTAFTAVGLGGVALSVRHARLHGWQHGRRWAHHVIGSAAMVIMTLAMPGTDSPPALALGGHSIAGMNHGHGQGSAGTSDASESVGHAGMAGMEHSSGMTSHDMTAGAAHSAAAGGSASVWRAVLFALAVYFLLSIVASVWARLRGTDRQSGAGRGPGRGRWARRLLALPDAIVVFVASLALSVWDKARPGGNKRRAHAAAGSRRRPPGTSPGAALTAHIGMGGTMCAMLVMMAG
ncbi:DUF5134 domain-containing protein [Streptomyces violaceochromogenes]|uniref:DUF5134 domain-containing protein n=1 Tax=Streptomyces violaceochromogenes TaxID=67377 RepID=A0ABU6LS38_9ACTN|nr:DUF5134 domain-containing protein [Streptomyces violaceochromogenes]MEC7052081.1 DUF5134 domain-containing protein [Streptomyces violaceochromogenes]GHC94416.1 hypothetical protein GCM10010309_79900 [Streptomyces violaceochromogenes]